MEFNDDEWELADEILQQLVDHELATPPDGDKGALADYATVMTVLILRLAGLCEGPAQRHHVGEHGAAPTHEQLRKHARGLAVGLVREFVPGIHIIARDDGFAFHCDPGGE